MGSAGERIAADRLQAMGYQVVERNARLSQGEIDIVAREGGELVFIEVRTRRGREFGLAEESITERKKRKLRSLVDLYLQMRQMGDEQSRIDVVVLELDRDGAVTRFEVIKNAVGD